MLNIAVNARSPCQQPKTKGLRGQVFKVTCFESLANHLWSSTQSIEFLI